MLEKLQGIGLSKKESEIYLALARREHALANELARYTSSNRTVTYNVLQQLVEKGIIAYVTRSNKRYYSIADPNNLLVPFREKELIAKQVIGDIQRISPIKPANRNVEVFEGVAGTKSIHQEIQNADELRILSANGLIFEHLRFTAHNIVKKESEKLQPRMIATQAMKKTPLNNYKKFKVKFLPKECENYATTFIFDDKVVIQILKDKPFLVKLENKELFDGYRKLFDFIWDKL